MDYPSEHLLNSIEEIATIKNSLSLGDRALTSAKGLYVHRKGLPSGEVEYAAGGRFSTKITFVKELDFVSGLGHHPDRVSGRGAKYLVTDLGQFDFENGHMRLTHIHPGVALDRFRAKTGFDLRVAEELKTTEPPSEHELQLLNEVIDPLGIRSLEQLSGAKRRAALRVMLEKERGQVVNE